MARESRECPLLWSNPRLAPVQPGGCSRARDIFGTPGPPPERTTAPSPINLGAIREFRGLYQAIRVVNFSFARFDGKIAWNQAGRGPGEGRARAGQGPGEAGRGTGEERARTGECKGVRRRGRKTLMFGGCESVSRAKGNLLNQGSNPRSTTARLWCYSV